MRRVTSETAVGGIAEPRATSVRFVHFPGMASRFSLPVQGAPSFGAGARGTDRRAEDPEHEQGDSRHGRTCYPRTGRREGTGPIGAAAPVVLHAGSMPSPAPDSPRDLLGLPLDHLMRFVEDELGERPFHARQIYRWIHQRGVTDFEQMTDLSKSLRAKLRDRCALDPLAKDLEQRSTDGTIKYRWRTRDGRLIESVYMPAADRKTLCVSTQVGCAMACKFCMTGTLGLLRNLTAAEIVAQVHAVNREVRAQRGPRS